MTNQQENAEKSISEQLSDILSQLSKDQLRFVVAVQEYASKKEAAEAIGLRPDTVYRWNGDIDEAIKLLALDMTETARQIMKKNLSKAVMVKMTGLDSDDEKLRQSVATEVIEWGIGKAVQKQEVDVKNGHILITTLSDQSLLTDLLPKDDEK